MLRIFGRTTLVSQFMVCSDVLTPFEGRLKEYMAAGPLPGKPPYRPPAKRNYGLFGLMFRSPYALGQGGGQLSHRVNCFGRRTSLRIEAVLERIDQRGADHRTIGLFSDGARRVRR